MIQISESSLQVPESALYLLEPKQRTDFVSAGALRLLGYEPEEFRGDEDRLRRLVHPDDLRSLVVQSGDLSAPPDSPTRIYRMRHRATDAYHWIEDSRIPLIGEDGSLLGIVGIARDISVLKRAEFERQREKGQVEALIDAMPDVILVCDDRGIVRKANTAVERILGWPLREVIGRPVEALLPEELRERHFRLRTQLSTTSFHLAMGHFELSTIHKEGKEGTVDISLASLGGMEEDHSVVLIRDMTEGRKAQAGMAYLSAIAMSAEDSIIGCTVDGVIASWNHGAERLFGYTEEEVLGKHLVMIYAQDRQRECFENLRLIGRRERPPRFESRRVRKNGAEFDASVIVAPIEDSEGKLLGMSCICRDVTERKRTESSLRTAKRAAEMASQAKSEFLANMSHELRTPLNGILGLTEQLLDTELTEEDRRENLQLILDSGRSLLATLSEILDLSKIQSGKYFLQPRIFRLRELLNSCVREFEGPAQAKRLRISWTIDPALPRTMRGDADCIHQILSILLDNAIKFTAAGEVTVTVDGVPHTPGALLIKVKDTGMGIPKSEQQRIFEPFSQVDNSLRRQFGGTGLGLAICAQLCELMGGEIRLESDGLSGSTFQARVALEALEDSTGVDAAGDQAGAMQMDRRREARRPVQVPGLMKVLRPFAAGDLQIRVLNLSDSGLKVLSRTPLEAGTLVQIDLTDRFVIAEVRYCRLTGLGYHMGLERVPN